LKKVNFTTDLQEQGSVDLSEFFIDGSFCMAKKGQPMGKTKKGKGVKVMAIKRLGFNKVLRL